MSAWGPGYPIQPPGIQLPLHGLTNTAVFPPDETDNRWMLGFEFEPVGVIPTIGYPGAFCDQPNSSPPLEKPDKPVDEPPPLINYMPWTMVTSYSCPHGRTEDERIEKVRAQLAWGESKALEHELWTGEAGQASGYQNMSLIYPDAGQVDELAILNPGYVPASQTPSQAVAVDLITGLSLLGQALANHGNGQRGMIHVTPQVAEIAAAGGLWEEDTRGGGSVLRTKGRGDLLVVGSGYPGTGPGGDTPAANHVWLHATGLVQIRLGPVDILPAKGDFIHAVTRTSNSTITHIAERTAAVYWDGLDYASVLVDLTDGWIVGGFGE